MENFAWQDLAYPALLLLVAILNIFTNGKSSKRINEVINMFRSVNYRNDNPEVVKEEAQTFNPLVDQYRLNERTNQLELLPNKLDIRQFVNSCLSSCLEQSLSRLLVESDEANAKLEDSVELLDLSDDLDYFNELSEVVEDYRDRYGLSVDMSLEDVYSDMQNRLSSLKSKRTSEEDLSKKLQDDNAKLSAQLAEMQEETKKIKERLKNNA